MDKDLGLPAGVFVLITSRLTHRLPPTPAFHFLTTITDALSVVVVPL